MIQLITTKIENGRSIENEGYISIIPIRIQATNKTLQNKNGSQTIASYKIILANDVEISMSNKIMYEGKKWEILSLYKAEDGNGSIHHIQVII